MDEQELSQTQDDNSTLDTTNDENLNNEVDQEVQETGSEDTQEEQVEEEQEEELSPRQQKRVEQIEEMKLNKILENVTGKRHSQPKTEYNPLDYSQALDTDEETANRLAQDREEYGNAKLEEGRGMASEQLQYMEWKNNIRFDLPIVKAQLDQLPPAVAKAIDREYLLYSGADIENGKVTNPNISYAEFVEAQIEKAEMIAAVKTQESRTNIAKQASQTGLRPGGGVSRANKLTSPEDIASIPQDDWEKNRASYLAQLGVNYKPNK